MPLTTRCRGLVINRDGYRGLFNDGDIDKGTQFLLDKIDDSKLRTQDSTSLNILDLGCGSGIMPLWIMAYSEQKKIIPLPHIDACDISPLAVTCAQHNTEKYKNIKVILSDIMTNDYFHDKQYDLIITNPPFAAGKKTVREFFRQ
ncbi:methyltransferase [Patescibacteria group bacterium]|nr:methyltransferase [Patescibacteria group bacterium]